MPRAQGTPRMIRVSGPSAEFSFSRGERKSILTVRAADVGPVLAAQVRVHARSGGRQARVMRKANGIFAGVA
jgi:hypothetical protein